MKMVHDVFFLLLFSNIYCRDDFILISFIINSPLQFLYHVVGTCDDREPSFVGVDGQQ